MLHQETLKLPPFLALPMPRHVGPPCFIPGGFGFVLSAFIGRRGSAGWNLPFFFRNSSNAFILDLGRFIGGVLTCLFMLALAIAIISSTRLKSLRKYPLPHPALT